MVTVKDSSGGIPGVNYSRAPSKTEYAIAKATGKSVAELRGGSGGGGGASQPKVSKKPTKEEYSIAGKAGISVAELRDRGGVSKVREQLKQEQQKQERIKQEEKERQERIKAGTIKGQLEKGEDKKTGMDKYKIPTPKDFDKDFVSRRDIRGGTSTDLNKEIAIQSLGIGGNGGLRSGIGSQTPPQNKTYISFSDINWKETISPTETIKKEGVEYKKKDGELVKKKDIKTFQDYAESKFTQFSDIIYKKTKGKAPDWLVKPKYNFRVTDIGKGVFFAPAMLTTGETTEVFLPKKTKVKFRGVEQQTGKEGEVVSKIAYVTDDKYPGFFTGVTRFKGGKVSGTIGKGIGSKSRIQFPTGRVVTDVYEGGVLGSSKQGTTYFNLGDDVIKVLYGKKGTITGGKGFVIRKGKPERFVSIGQGFDVGKQSRIFGGAKTQTGDIGGFAGRMAKVSDESIDIIRSGKSGVSTGSKTITKQDKALQESFKVISASAKQETKTGVSPVVAGGMSLSGITETTQKYDIDKERVTKQKPEPKQKPELKTMPEQEKDIFQPLAFREREAQDVAGRTKTKQKQKQKPKQEQEQFPLTTTKTRTKTKQKGILKTRFKQKQTTKSRGLFSFPTSPFFRGGFPAFPPYKPQLKTGKKKAIQTGKQPTQYQPSFTAGVFKIKKKGKLLGKELGYSPFTIRGLGKSKKEVKII